VSRSAPKRRAESGRRRGAKEPKPGPRRRAEPVPAPVEEPREPAAAPTRPPRSRRRLLLAGGALLGIAGVAAVVARALGQEPDWLGRTGSVALSMLLSAALAGRTGGRPFVFGLLAGACATAAVVTGSDLLLGGATVGVVAIGSVLAVVGTVPASRIVDAVREVVVAAVVAGSSALAAYGFAPHLDLERFKYLTLGLALVGGFAMIYRLGAGLHGLGTRGLLTVVVGTVLLAFTVAYAELLRRYGTPDVAHTLAVWAQWMHDHLGGVPRPLVLLLGVPALTWGTHMRARRRQGWWVCLFGVAATAPIGEGLLDPTHTWTEAVLASAYGVAGGVLLGIVLIWVDVWFTLPRASARRAVTPVALRPEPRRTEPLL
jgi:hypothetical protein